MNQGEKKEPKSKTFSVDLIQARKLTRTGFQEKAQRYLFMSRGEIEALSKDPGTDMLDLMIISVITKAIKHGDEKRLDFLLDRLIGKVVKPLSFTGDGPLEPKTIPIPISRDEKIYMLEQMKKRLVDDQSYQERGNSEHSEQQSRPVTAEIVITDEEFDDNIEGPDSRKD